VEAGCGYLAGDAAQRCAEAAAHIEDARRCRVEMKAAEDLAVHMLEHGFAMEGFHAAAEEAEVHVEVRAPGSIVGTGLRIVALEVVGSGGRC